MLTSSSPPLPLPLMAKTAAPSPPLQSVHRAAPLPSHDAPLNPQLLLSLLPQEPQPESPQAARNRARSSASVRRRRPRFLANSGVLVPSPRPFLFSLVHAHLFDTFWCPSSQRSDGSISDRARPPPPPTPVKNQTSTGAPHRRPLRHRLRTVLLSPKVAKSLYLSPPAHRNAPRHACRRRGWSRLGFRPSRTARFGPIFFGPSDLDPAVCSFLLLPNRYPPIGSCHVASSFNLFLCFSVF